jgi:hypothetical protein
MHAATFESTQYRDFGELRKPESEKRGSTGKKLHALDSGDTAQYRQALRRERTQGTPRAFEFIDAGVQTQEFGRDLDGTSFQHTPNITPNFTHLHRLPIKTPIYTQFLAICASKKPASLTS